MFSALRPHTGSRLLTTTAVQLALILSIAPVSHASDGETEISQARANQGLVTPADGAGFPVTISVPGAYRLTSNLVVTGPVDAIEIVVPGVQLDLNGFSIDGLDVGNRGIFSTESDVTLRNGTIRNMTGDGVDVGEYARISGLRSIDNGGDGIDVGSGGSVTGSTAANNGSFGIRGSLGCSVIGSISRNNGGDGINLGAGGSILENTVRDNTTDGLQCGTSCTISHNAVLNNDGDGINAALSFGSTIIGNAVRSNDLLGIDMADDAGYAHNVVTNNNGAGNNGQVDGGVPLDSNLCATNLFNRICP